MKELKKKEHSSKDIDKRVRATDVLRAIVVAHRGVEDAAQSTATGVG
jgi:hypothetical protein